MTYDDISRISLTRLQTGLWHLAFYAKARRVYEEFHNDAETALALAPRVLRERFADETEPPLEYYEHEGAE